MFCSCSRTSSIILLYAAPYIKTSWQIILQDWGQEKGLFPSEACLLSSLRQWKQWNPIIQKYPYFHTIARGSQNSVDEWILSLLVVEVSEVREKPQTAHRGTHSGLGKQGKPQLLERDLTKPYTKEPTGIREFPDNNDDNKYNSRWTMLGHSLEEKLGAGPAQETNIRWVLFSSMTDMWRTKKLWELVVLKQTKRLNCQWEVQEDLLIWQAAECPEPAVMGYRRYLTS